MKGEKQTKDLEIFFLLKSGNTWLNFQQKEANREELTVES